MVINNDKTHLVVMGPKKGEAARKLVNIDSGTVVITPTETEQLLGNNIHQALKWQEHLVNNNKSLVAMLSTRLSARKRVIIF